jgi:hypothetical protein
MTFQIIEERDRVSMESRLNELIRNGWRVVWPLQWNPTDEVYYVVVHT